jgi:uncharacterized membrane protein
MTLTQRIDNTWQWFILHPGKSAIIAVLVVAAITVAIIFVPPAAAFCYHWIFADLYQNMWSNIFAPSAITLVAVLFAYLKGKWHRQRLHDEAMQKADEHHEALKAHITANACNH